MVFYTSLIFGFKHVLFLNLTYAAKIQTNKEHYKTALDLSQRASKHTILKSTQLLAVQETNKILALQHEYTLFNQGISYTNTNNWQKAMETWGKIPINSIYTSRYISYKNVDHKKPTGDIVHLINYTYAKDPTWNQLMEFLALDSTDDLIYDLNEFVCTGFAETLHNNAERAGIRVAYIGIRFTEDPGHALTAFDTTDKGLVYVDNTGQGYTNLRGDFLETRRCEWDKIAYVEKDREYGSISINYKLIDPTNYEHYQTYMGGWSLVTDKYYQLEGTIESYNKMQKEYKKLNSDYLNSVTKYNEQALALSEKTQRLQKEMEDKYAKQNESLTEKIALLKTDIQNFNSEVELYNKTGEGDVQKLQIEKDRLDELSEKLKEEELALGNNMEKEIEKISEDLKEERASLQEDELTRLKESLDDKSANIENASLALNVEFSALKNKEIELGICYWKSLGMVTQIEEYW